MGSVWAFGWETQMAAFIVLWDLANLLEDSGVADAVWSHLWGARCKSWCGCSLGWFLLRSAPDASSAWAQSILKLCWDQGTKLKSISKKLIYSNFQTNFWLPVGATWPPEDQRSKRQESWEGRWAQRKPRAARGWESRALSFCRGGTKVPDLSLLMSLGWAEMGQLSFWRAHRAPLASSHFCF